MLTVAVKAISRAVAGVAGAVQAFRFLATWALHALWRLQTAPAGDSATLDVAGFTGAHARMELFAGNSAVPGPGGTMVAFVTRHG